jgi:bla regulator protein blaR1
MNRSLLRVAPLFLAAAVGVSAQDARPRFTTATIRRNVSGRSSGGGAYIVNGRLQMTNVDANTLIRIAYTMGLTAALAPSQVVDGPDWLTTDTYDVTAVTGPEFQGKRTNQLMLVRRLLLQSLLEERFKLTVHHDVRQLQQYVLALSPDRAPGPQLTRSSSTCAGQVDDSCAVRVSPGRFSMGRAPLAALVGFLSNNVLRTVVVDRTGLQGMFALTLEWPAEAPATGPAPIIAALRDQLGLNLTVERAPVDVIVVDHVERPALD